MYQDIVNKDQNKLQAVVPISEENAIPFSSFMLLDNDVKVTDRNAGENENPKISAEELEPTEHPMDKHF